MRGAAWTGKQPGAYFRESFQIHYGYKRKTISFAPENGVLKQNQEKKLGTFFIL